jgi:outer membrane protein assembly factor BamE (lipoprotein component of BamABCDE complex)
MLRKLALAAIAAACVACMTVGEDFAVGRVSHIRIGETTQSDIRKTFGEPWRVGLENGERTWTYGYYRYNLFGASQTRDLVVRFDDDGVVSSFTFNSTWPEDVQ